MSDFELSVARAEKVQWQIGNLGHVSVAIASWDTTDNHVGVANRFNL